MKLEIDFLSTEVVTPSSPTPPHLNHYKLSLLDQIAPPIFMPIHYFYPAIDNKINPIQKLNHLKKSLSQTLTLFYPLAGRLIDNSYVNCNDKGIKFIVAQANCKLYDFIKDPVPDEINKFIPCDPKEGRGNPCLAVQVTFFCCGGLAIGFSISHKIVDGFSIFMFFNSWAAISRGDDAVHFPKFESTVVFPPRGSGCLSRRTIEKKENIITKIFFFSAQKISDLRAKYYTKKNTNDEGLIGLSRSEILSSFIYTRFMVSTGAKHDANKVYAIRILVDIRTRVVPPLSEFHFGNIALPTITVPSLENDDDDHAEGIVKNIRDAIRNLDHRDYVTIKNNLKKASVSEEVILFSFSSLCRLPFSKADFGWGKPVWGGIAKIPLSNTIFFLNTFSGDGVEAWVNLKAEDMAKFEADEELLEYVSCTKRWSRI